MRYHYRDEDDEYCDSAALRQRALDIQHMRARRLRALCYVNVACVRVARVMMRRARR